MAGPPDEIKIEPLLQSSTDGGMNHNLESVNSLMNTNRMILKLQTQKFSIEQTIQNLEQKFRTGGLSADTYIRQFRQLQSELFIVEQKLSNMETYNP